MSRRPLVVLASLIAVAAGGASAFFATRGAGSDGSGASPKVAVLSPRRAPLLLHNLVAETRVASRVAAVMRSVGPSSCAVVQAGKSRVVNLRPNELLIPRVSALKLTTAAAFLSKVGGTGTFTTNVAGHDPDRSGVIKGDVVIEGGGDPLLATAAYVESRKHPPKPFTDFTKLVSEMQAGGVRHITGGIGVYDAYFDQERRVPTWSPGYTATGDVGPLGALALNDGFSAFTPHLVAAPDPALAVGAAFRAALVDAGVVVDGPTFRATSDPQGGVAGVESAPFAEIVGEMLSESDNNTAELLLKELARRVSGAPGTRAKGVEARNEALYDMGLNTLDIQAIDGSGLDRSDRATCDALVTTLTTRPGGYDLVDMLATAGRTGTLDDRFLTSPLVGKLRAKTGSLDNVTALVGVTDAKGDALRFAFMVNGSFSDAGGKALQDRFVAALATYPEAPAAAALAS